MSNVTGTLAAPRVDGGVSGGSSAGATTSPLLPPPASGQPDIGDAITQLLQASSQISEQQMLLGKSQVQMADGQRKIAAARRKEALDRAIEAARKAREAQKHRGGFFSFVTDNIGLTGLIGIATFNVGLVAADIAAHKTGLADTSTNLFDLGAAVFGGPLGYLAAQGAKELAPDIAQTSMAALLLGGPMGLALERAAEKIVPDDFEKDLDQITTIKDDDVRLANKIALMVATAAVAATSTVLTGGTSAPAIVALVGIGISTTTQIAAETGALKEIFGEKAAVYVALGGAITGAALTVGGSVWSVFSSPSGIMALKDGAKAAKTAKQIVSGFNAAKSIYDGVTTTMDGLRSLEAAEWQHDADLAKVDAQEQRNVLKRIEKIIDDILEDLKEAKESADRAAETLQAAAQTKNQTMLQAGAMKV